MYAVQGVGIIRVLAAVLVFVGLDEVAARNAHGSGFDGRVAGALLDHLILFAVIGVEIGLVVEVLVTRPPHRRRRGKRHRRVGDGPGSSAAAGSASCCSGVSSVCNGTETICLGSTLWMVVVVSAVSNLTVTDTMTPSNVLQGVFDFVW